MAPTASTAALTLVQADGTYADGEPFDRVDYVESKLALKPDRFTSVDAFHDFGRLVHRAAREVDVGFHAHPDAKRRPRVREIIFVDTPDFRLYNNGFILRRRRAYMDGFPVGEPEIVFKFRHPDERAAAAVDVRPHIAGSYRIKFKEQILPLGSHVGGRRVLYSHNCQFPLDHVHDGDRTAMETIVRVFPVLATLRKSRQERVSLVNEGIIEELLMPVARLDFGKGVLARSSLSLWRTRGTHLPLVGEFSYDVRMARPSDFCEKARVRADQFFVTLQHRVRDWIALGTTKTGLVYRLNGNASARLE